MTQLDRDIPLQNADAEEEYRKPDARLVDELLGATPLHEHCTTSAERSSQPRCAMLQKNENAEEDADEDVEGDKHTENSMS